MANEAVKVEGPYEVHDFTVITGTTISAMTLCKLTEPRTAAASSALSDVFAGIAATEFLGGRGKTQLGLYTRGIFKLTAVVTAGTEGPILTGSMVVLSGTNLIKRAIADELLSGNVLGKAMEDIAVNSSGEVFVGAI